MHHKPHIHTISHNPKPYERPFLGLQWETTLNQFFTGTHHQECLPCRIIRRSPRTNPKSNVVEAGRAQTGLPPVSQKWNLFYIYKIRWLSVLFRWSGSKGRVCRPPPRDHYPPQSRWGNNHHLKYAEYLLRFWIIMNMLVSTINLHFQKHQAVILMEHLYYSRTTKPSQNGLQYQSLSFMKVACKEPK